MNEQPTPTIVNCMYFETWDDEDGIAREPHCRRGIQIIQGCHTMACDTCGQKLPRRVSPAQRAPRHPNQECLRCDNMEWCAWWYNRESPCGAFKPADPASLRVLIRTAPRGLDRFLAAPAGGGSS